jgi:amino-acid N-acetyltransferase
MTTPLPPEVPPVIVREVTPADLPAARRLVADAGLPLDGLDDAEVLVAEIAGTLVGTVALERHGSGDDAAVLLRSATVDPAWRGRGLGALLTRAALERAREAPVALLTETAEEYFPRFGFHTVDRAALPRALGASRELQGACPSSARAMLRPAGEPSATWRRGESNP